MRDIRRTIEGQTALEETFALPLGRAAQIRWQQPRQPGWKLYSFHATEGGVHRQREADADAVQDDPCPWPEVFCGEGGVPGRGTWTSRSTVAAL